MNHTATNNTRLRWNGSPVMYYMGNLMEMEAHMPSFVRQSFGLADLEKKLTRLNDRLHVIVRLPFDKDETAVPVGVVSKKYVLVQHTEVLNMAIQAFEAAQFDPSALKAELTMTEYGERMALTVYLPEEYDYVPEQGDPMKLRLQCLNSVDGSTEFRAIMSWLRQVCSNGLTVGVTRYQMRRRHVGNIPMEDLSEVLAWGIEESLEEMRHFDTWRRTPISFDQLEAWVDGPLRERWGFKAATRAFHIALRGTDVDLVGSYKHNTPTRIAVRETQRVPGVPETSLTLFDMSQILAWLAKERLDIQEQFEWRETIPELLASLMHEARPGFRW